MLAYDMEIGALRIIDDSGEDYLYSPSHPRPIANLLHPGGRWEIVEDDENKTLFKAIGNQFQIWWELQSITDGNKLRRQIIIEWTLGAVEDWKYEL